MRNYLTFVLALLTFPIYGQMGTAISVGTLNGNSALIEVAEAARVRILVESSTGVPISLHDKMEGQIARSGATGVQDGRIDITLDAGEYRVQIDGTIGAEERPRISARAFTEINGLKSSAWPILIPGTVTSGSLKDLQAASYWIELREDGAIEIEALGRSLSTLELWREGQYLVGSYPVRETRQVEAGRPMGYACASVFAKKGLYLARLYGATGQPWEKDDGRNPLHIRSGFMSMPVGGRLDLRVSPFGRDFILVDDVDTAWLSRETKGVASFASRSYEPGKDRLAADYGAEIYKDSTDLRCSLGVPYGPALLRVEAASGELVHVDAFRRLDPAQPTEIRADHGGLLTIVAARTIAPEIPLTGLVLSYGKDRRAAIVEDFSAPLSRSEPFRGRCNLDGTGERYVVLRVDEAGSYQIAEKAGKIQGSALYTLYPLDSSFNAYGTVGNQAPAWEETYALDTGYYILRVSARSLGVLDFAIQKKGFGRFSTALGKEPPQNRQSRSWTFEPAEPSKPLYLLVGAGSSGDFGYSFKHYPVALDDGLSIDVGPRESLEFPTSVTRRGVFYLASGRATLILDGQIPVDGGTIVPGARTLTIRNATTTTAAAGFSVTQSFGDLPVPAAT
ncbi:MAG: hypothetical protein JXM71_11390, partial [Spirochaetales bacterium]|nr:hypothetical protein [Spirochaetales bacterium]